MIRRSFLVLWVVLFCGLGRTAHADDILTVVNDMDEPVWLFIKSEHRDRWRRTTAIGRGRQVQIPLGSPDRFEIVTADRQGGYYYSGLLPLRLLLQADPSLVINLGGIVEVQTESERYWTRRWGWRIRQRDVVVRTHVLYTFVESNGIESSLAAPRRGR